jgi:hypothetical protein
LTAVVDFGGCQDPVQGDSAKQVPRLPTTRMKEEVRQKRQKIPAAG